MTYAPQRDLSTDDKAKLAQAIMEDCYDLLDFVIEPSTVLMNDCAITNGNSVGHIWRGHYEHDEPESTEGEAERNPTSLTMIVDDRQGDVRTLLAAECRRIANLYECLAQRVEGRLTT